MDSSPITTRLFAFRPGPVGEALWLAKVLALALLIAPAVMYASGLPPVIGVVMAFLVVLVVGGFVIADSKAAGAPLRGLLWQVTGAASAFGIAFVVGPLKW